MAPVKIETQKVICFHETFYMIGTNKEAVSRGVEAEGVHKRTYEQVKSTKKDMVAENEEIMCFPVIEPYAV